MMSDPIKLAHNADVNQVEATSKRGDFMIATNQGLFLVEISLSKMDIKIVRTFLQGLSIQSLAYIEPNKMLLSTQDKKLIIFDTEN